MAISSFSSHHIAISVRNLERTIEFYQIFGFRLCVLWQATDNSLRIAHLALEDGRVLEIFEYVSNANAMPLELEIGNDLEAIGVKHFGLNVPNIEGTYHDFTSRGYGALTPIKHGRTKIDYFFVRDPDGMWVEVVQETRQLDPDHPTYLRP